MTPERRTVRALTAAAVVGAYPLVSGSASFVVVATGYAVCATALGATRQTAVALFVPAHERTVVRGRLQALQNVGIGAGAGLGGAAAVVGTTASYTMVLLLDAVALLVAAGLLGMLPRHRTSATPRPRAGMLRDRRFVAAAALNAVLLLQMPLLSVVLPLWIATATAAPPVTVALAFLTNTAGVAALQTRAARRVPTLAAAVRAMRRAGRGMLLATAAIGAAGLTHHAAPACAAVASGVVLLTLAEVEFSAASWTIGYALTPPGAEGRYQAVWGAGVPVARAAGPLLLTAGVLAAGPLGWLALGGCLAAAGAAMTPLLRRVCAPATAPSSSVGLAATAPAARSQGLRVGNHRFPRGHAGHADVADTAAD
ncbi:MFS transporter [Couchioplanes azureus]|uniref:MFS transporter n=1 Tax=Couchioplanes caeruleus TaxID=56438 RepID=UPI0016708B02|nr:MFS transporter [Couchioplanes caeruleus]GGQ85646.1 hypothetical protein GCM10010166_65000 [Couchioplanes caeruleus subsp. azureus]